MKIFIPKARIIHPKSTLNGTTQDVWIEDGVLTKVPNNAAEIADKVLDEGLCISPGWVDLRARSFDPGFPEKENMRSLLSAAKAGGFTHIGIMPDCHPAADQRSILEYWKSQSLEASSNPVFLGSMSKENKGKDLAELFDMKDFGAKAFSDNGIPIQNTLFLKVAMEYASMTGLTLMLRPDDPFISKSGEARESINSHQSGLSSVPEFSEKLGIDKICELARYTNCPVHLTSISTAAGVESIRNWKKSGLPITADVSIAHLTMDDSNILGFDSNFKHYPPLPPENDKIEIAKAVQDGTIDIVCSDHHPVNIERKFCEFHLAEEGISSVQATYSLLRSAVDSLTNEKTVEVMCLNPRSLFGMTVPNFEIGEIADYTVFNPEGIAVYSHKDWESLSENFPYFGKELKGKVIDCFKPSQK